MAQQTINVGAAPNDGTGTPLRTAFQYTNSNFTELYTAVGPSGNNIVVPGNATITGDLTVDTSTLKVDSANNRVGIVTATPATALDVNGDITQRNGSGTIIGNIQNSSGLYDVKASVNVTGLQLSTAAATPIIFALNNVEAMRLDSTGLGVGVSPSYNIHARGTTNGRIQVEGASGFGMVFIQGSSGNTAQLQLNSSGGTGRRFNLYSDPTGFFGISDETAVATRLTIDSSGNVGIGVTPSAWVTGKALQVGTTGTSLWGYADTTYLTQNAAGYPSTSFIYGTTNLAAAYQMQTGVHKWFIAPSGTAGNAITWTQAMTLDASGNLLVGTTSSPLASRVSVGVTNAQPDAFVIRNSDATAGLYWRLAYVNSSNTFHILNQSGVGVYLTDGATSWTGTSDERLKDIIEPISNAVAKVGSLRSVIGKFKNDSEGTRRSFLIAQDVQAVLPEAVDTTNADAFGLRYTEVIPLLVAAIKELTARVQTIETR